MHYLVTEIGKGALYVMPAPRPRQLHNHIRYLKMNGLTKVLCLMEPTEMERLQLGAEESYCTHEGLEFENFPIVDHSITDPEKLRPLAKRLLQEIKEGAHLVVHCFAGIGRTGIVSCAILIENAMSAEQAMEVVSEKRQLRVPETQEQEEFVKRYARAC